VSPTHVPSGTARRRGACRGNCDLQPLFSVLSACLASCPVTMCTRFWTWGTCTWDSGTWWEASCGRPHWPLPSWTPTVYVGPRRARHALGWAACGGSGGLVVQRALLLLQRTWIAVCGPRTLPCSHNTPSVQGEFVWGQLLLGKAQKSLMTASTKATVRVPSLDTREPRFEFLLKATPWAAGSGGLLNIPACPAGSLPSCVRTANEDACIRWLWASGHLELAAGVAAPAHQSEGEQSDILHAMVQVCLRPVYLVGQAPVPVVATPPLAPEERVTLPTCRWAYSSSSPPPPLVSALSLEPPRPSPGVAQGA
jgi:hypothetical protein